MEIHICEQYVGVKLKTDLEIRSGTLAGRGSGTAHNLFALSRQDSPSFSQEQTYEVLTSNPSLLCKVLDGSLTRGVRCVNDEAPSAYP